MQAGETSPTAVAIPSHGVLVKPKYSLRRLALRIALAVVTCATLVGVTLVTEPHLIAQTVVFASIAFALLAFSEVSTYRARKRADTIQQAAAAGDDAVTVALLTPASAPSAGQLYADNETLVVEVAVRWRTMVVIGGMGAGIAALCGYGAWSSSDGPRTLIFVGAGRANAIQFLLRLGGVGVGVAILLLLANEARWRFIADAQGFELRYRWTRRRIAWQEVRLFWVTSAPNKQKPALTAWDEQLRIPGGAWPQRIPPGIYELAGRRRIVRFTVSDAATVRTGDVAEYERRMQALFGAIVFRSQTPLRMAK